MLSFENYTELLHELNSNLTVFLSIEKAMLNCGLRPFDFKNSTKKIESIKNETLHIKEKLHHHKGQSKGNHSIDTALTYTNYLLKSINQLCTISSKLAKKANGEKYGFFAYRKDLKIYKNYEKDRESYGTQLNIALSHPW